MKKCRDTLNFSPVKGGREILARGLLNMNYGNHNCRKTGPRITADSCKDESTRCNYCLESENSCVPLGNRIGGNKAEAARALDIEVRLILSMNRHESVEIGESVLAAALNFRDRGVVALDLAGNEHDFPAEPFWGLFEHAKESGLGVTIHAGEWGGASNVREAVERLHADRVGHGVRAIEDPALIEWLIERGTVLEVCPTSNIQSGVVLDWAHHPLKQLFVNQVLTTINTDDPLVSNITLSDEIVRVVEDMGLGLENMKRQTLTAAQAAFLPEDERSALVAKFEALLTPAL